jgi:hypothetical protein
MTWRSKNIGLVDDVELAPRKSYIAFTRGNIFAVARASTKTRLDLGLKLPGTPPRKRLVDAAGLASDSISHKSRSLRPGRHRRVSGKLATRSL